MIARSHLRAADGIRLGGALVWVVLALGCVALAARQVGQAGLVVTMAAGAIGLGVPQGRLGRDHDGPSTWPAWAAAVALGLGAFVVARALVLAPPEPLRSVAVAGNVAAAFAEEAFFRRLLFGRLLRWGPAVAIVASAVAFAAVHLPAYGSGAFVVDVAAGLVFGWQRWVGRSWTAPALTHAAVNVLQMI
jgi:membrane protease YdiL (CAAX protease family)